MPLSWYEVSLYTTHSTVFDYAILLVDRIGLTSSQLLLVMDSAGILNLAGAQG